MAIWQCHQAAQTLLKARHSSIIGALYISLHFTSNPPNFDISGNQKLCMRSRLVQSILLTGLSAIIHNVDESLHNDMPIQEVCNTTCIGIQYINEINIAPW